MEHIRPGALFNFESEYGDQENPIYSYTKNRSQNRTPFCTAAQNYETVLISTSSKDVGLLWYHQMLERIMCNYQLKLPYILYLYQLVYPCDTGSTKPFLPNCHTFNLKMISV